MKKSNYQHSRVKVKMSMKWSCTGNQNNQWFLDVPQYLYNIGWPWGGYKNILPEMLTILPESKTRVILLASRAIYSCIPRKRAIQYYYYSYRALCVILLSNDRGWLPAAILSLHESESLWDVATVTKVGRGIARFSELWILTTYRRRKSMLNDWSHKVRAIF